MFCMLATCIHAYRGCVSVVTQFLHLLGSLVVPSPFLLLRRKDRLVNIFLCNLFETILNFICTVANSPSFSFCIQPSAIQGIPGHLHVVRRIEIFLVIEGRLDEYDPQFQEQVEDRFLKFVESRVCLEASYQIRSGVLHPNKTTRFLLCCGVSRDPGYVGEVTFFFFVGL